MLSFFRRGGFAQVIVGAIVFAIIIVFVLEFRAGRGTTGSLTDECAVELGDYCVEPKEYFASYNLVLGGRNLTPKQIRQLEAHRAILDGLAERELLVQQAERLGLSISEDEVNEDLRRGRAHISLPAEREARLSYYLGLCVPEANGRCVPGTAGLRALDVKKDGAFDYERYERNVRIFSNRSPKEFKNMQVREMIADRLRALVRARAQVSESEAFSIFERESSNAVARIVQLRKPWFERYAVQVSDVSLDEYMNKHKESIDKLWEAEKAKFSAGCPLVREILIDFGGDDSDETKALKRTEIQEAERRLRLGADFGALARELSDSESAAWGGQIGCLNEDYGLGAEALLQAVGKLKDGQTSSVVESPRGYHLIKRVGTLQKGSEEKLGRRLLARRMQIETRADELANEFAKELIAAVSKGEKLDAATERLGSHYAIAEGVDAKAALADDARPKVVIGTQFTRAEGPIDNALPGENVAAAVFELKPDAVIEKPIKTSEGYAVLQLKELNLATKEDFDKDKVELMRGLRQAKAEEALMRYVAELRRAAGDGLKVNASFAEPPKADTQSGEG